MKQPPLLIVTAHPEFLEAAIGELKRLDSQFSNVSILAPGVAIGNANGAATLMRAAARQRPTFVRHLAPVHAIISLTNTDEDIGTIATTMAMVPSFSMLERGQRFAVQTRFVQDRDSEHSENHANHAQRPYSSGQLNQQLAEAIAEETGAIESVKKPQIVVSILCTRESCYLGISPVEENLSAWPGGTRHFAQTEEQISRAEFKLLEALEVFGVSLPSHGVALDLGAAPGGWTRLLLEAGLNVVAVDPAKLDTRLARSTRLEHYRGHAETYLEEAIKQHKKFDVIVNDMRMDARDAARLLAQAASCLRSNDGFVLSTMKLPHTTAQINPLATLHEAMNILRKSYGIVEARQLFHNRQEVTVIAAQPLSTRI